MEIYVAYTTFTKLEEGGTYEQNIQGSRNTRAIYRIKSTGRRELSLHLFLCSVESYFVK